MKFNFEITEDGSPTAYLNEYENERMHHSGGALGETIYIYGPAIQWAFSKVDKPSILSLGTGLGYNEILTAAFSVIFDQEFILHSYESNDILNSSLENWVLSTSDIQLRDLNFLNNQSFEQVPFEVYNYILNEIANKFDLPADSIKSKLLGAFKTDSWCLNKKFEKPTSRYNAILYDFFSKKAMESFWAEEYLVSFFKEAPLDYCAVATYACTGALKRAFKANGFELLERKGYLWKRTSTFAMLKKGI